MSDTPKKTLTLNRKPNTGDTPAPGQVRRSGKRIIRREDLPGINKPSGAGKGHCFTVAGRNKDDYKKESALPHAAPTC